MQRQTITVDSVAAAKRVNAKIIEGVRKRLRPQANAEDLSSGDDEIEGFGQGELSDEAILRREAYKRKNAVDKRIERRAMASKRLEEMQQRLDVTNWKLHQAAKERQRRLCRKREAVDPLPDRPFWPYSEVRPQATRMRWSCPRFPETPQSSVSSKVLFKLALDLDRSCLSRDIAFASAVKVQQFGSILHCCPSQHPSLAIDIIGGQASLCTVSHEAKPAG